MALWRRLHGYILIVCALAVFEAAIFIIFVFTREAIRRETNLIAYKVDHSDSGQKDKPSHQRSCHRYNSDDRSTQKTTFEARNQTRSEGSRTAFFQHVAWLADNSSDDRPRFLTGLNTDELFSRSRGPVQSLGPPCTGPRKYIDPRMKAYDLLKLKRPNLLKTHKNPCWRGRWWEGEQRLFCVPFFFIVGQPKCGTTDLHYKLSRHPHIAAKNGSALHWLARKRFNKNFEGIGNVSRATYRHLAKLFHNHSQDFIQHYTPKPGGQFLNPLIFGESSPSTFGDNSHWTELEGNEGCSEPRVVNPIYLYHMLPQAKVILTLQDPVSRLYSSYHYFTIGLSPQHFHRLAKEEVRVYTQCFAQFPVRQCVYNNTLNSWSKLRTAIGFYSVFLKDWLKTFPRDQIYISILEEFSRAPEIGLKKIFDFLEVAPLHPRTIQEIAALRRRNVGTGRNKSADMLDKTRDMLQEFYRPFNEELRNILIESPNPLT